MLKKLAFAFLGLALVVSSMGAVVAPAVAETISDGDLVKVAGDSAVYLVDGDNVRVFPHESVFWSWGYADWSGVMTVSQSTLDSYSEGLPVPFRAGILFTSNGTGEALEGFEENAVFFQNEDGSISPIRDEDAYDVLVPTLSDGSSDWSYITNIPNSFLENFTNFEVGEIFTTSSTLPDGMVVSMDDTTYIMQGGEARELSMSVAEANGLYTDEKGWAVKVIPATGLTVGSAATNADVTDVDEVPTWEVTIIEGDLDVSVSSSTPETGYVSKGAQNVIFTKVALNPEGGSVVVDEIIIERKGLGYDADIDTIRLYNGTEQVGNDQSVNTTTHQARFRNLNWAVSGNTTLTIKANVASGATGTNVYLEVADITTEGDATVSGLPVAGNPMEFSALSVGRLDVIAQSIASTPTVISGETDVELGCWNFVTSSTEGFYVDSIKLSNIGSAAYSEAKDFYLKVVSDTIPGSEVSAMDSDGKILFDLTENPYYIDNSKTKKVCLYGDVAAGITVSKTLRFQVEEARDVVARGRSSAGEVLITKTSGAVFTAQASQTNNIAQGSATLTQNAAYAPSTGSTLVVGSENHKMAAYKLTAGANEGVRLTKLRLTFGGTNITSADFNNWKLFKIVDGEEVEIPVSGSTSSAYVTFEDTSDGLIDVAKSENETIIVRADVSSSAAGSSAHVYVAADGATGNDTVAKIMGIDSEEYVTDGVTTSGVATGNAQTFSFGSTGAVAVSAASSNPAADTVAKGAEDVHMLDINFYATGEDVELTELYVTAQEATSGTATAEVADITNIKLIDKETGEQLGSTATSLSTGVASFGISKILPKEENVVISVYADIPSTSSPDNSKVSIEYNSSSSFTGVSSLGTISESPSTANGNDMTVSSPTLVAAMSTSPVATSHVINTTDVTLGRLVLTAGSTEDVKVTSVKVSAGTNTDDLDATSAANTSFRNVRLVNDSDEGIQYGTTQSFTDGTPDYISFTGITNLTVADGESEILKIVGDIAASTGTFEFGVADASSDITAVGVSSGTDATVTPNGSTIVSTAVTCASSGSLKVNKAADIPVAAQLVSGTSGVTVMKYKLEGTYEDVDITSLPIYYNGTVADLGPFYLYVDGVQVGAESGYEFTTGLKTVTFEPGTLIVDKDAPTYLTIKADIRPKAQVTTSVSTVNIGIADSGGNGDGWGGAESYNIVAKGYSSGTTITATDIDSDGDGGGNVYGSNDYTIHKGVLTATLNSSTPDGYRTAGSGEELIRFDLTATGDEITVNELEFCVTGNAEISGTGTVYLKNSAGTLTYASLTDTEFENYWDTFADGADDADSIDPILDTTKTATEATCFSFGDQSGSASTTVAGNTKAFTNTPVIAEGDTLTFKLTGDTTGAATNKTLKVSINPNPLSICGAGAVSCAATTSGIEWKDSSAVAVDVDLTTTEGLPLYGETLLY